LQKQRTQSLNRGLVEGRQKARERRAVRQTFPSEQGHEWASEWLHALVERGKSRFAADGIPQQHRHKVDEIIVPETATRKAHLLLYRHKHALAFQEVRDHAHFAKPAGR